MYKSIYYDRREQLIHLWDDELGYNCFPYDPYAYIADPEGEYVTMTGIKVKKVQSWPKELEASGMIFEHDVPPVTRTLIDLYGESDDPSINHTIFYFDIEVARGKKYSKPAEALNTITSISYYDSVSKQYICLLLNPAGDIKSKDNIKVFNTEPGMLSYFLNEFRRIDPSIVTGWHTSGFDIPYLYNRICNVLGKKSARKLSPIGVVYTSEYKGNYEVIIAGVNCMDYLTLYKKFTYNEEPSYTLDAISMKELGRGKVKYEGSLDQLYENDIEKFVEYNISDVELVVALDAKLDFIEIARGICHKGHVSYEDFPYSSKYLDGACLTYGKRKNIVLIGKAVKRTDQIDRDAEGAFVKSPKPGLYKYVYDLDIESEYPNNIRTLNISPETKWGRISDWNPSDLANDVIKPYKVQKIKNIFDEFDLNQSPDIEVTDLRKFLDENQLTISAAGIMYKTDQIGMVPAILAMEKYKYYNRKQLVTKILLNSLYGVLLLRTFRFYDLENGESVTMTGQHLIQYSSDMGNVYYKRHIQNNDRDYCLYIDTDAVFFEALPIINVRYPDNDGSDQFLIEKTREIASELEKYINNSYNLYALKFYNAKTHTWRIKQEMIGKTAFWRDKKKRYAMHIVNKDGLNVDEIEIKGFDSVRSDFPKAYRKFVKQSINDILRETGYDNMNEKVKTFQSFNSETDCKDILLPTSVKNISKYGTTIKGIPIHVKSAINYNSLLKLWNLEQYPTIEDGDKISWCYLQQNPFNFDTMAINGYDDPPEIIEFVNKYIDREMHFDKRLLSKLQPIWDNLGWGKVQLEDQSIYF